MIIKGTISWCRIIRNNRDYGICTTLISLITNVLDSLLLKSDSTVYEWYFLWLLLLFCLCFELNGLGCLIDYKTEHWNRILLNSINRRWFDSKTIFEMSSNLSYYNNFSSNASESIKKIVYNEYRGRKSQKRVGLSFSLWIIQREIINEEKRQRLEERREKKRKEEEAVQSTYRDRGLWNCGFYEL